MEIIGGDYESCKNMIWKLALDRYNLVKKTRPDIQFDDLLGEGMLVYSTCLTTFKGNKGMKFSTYLYQNLIARLRDYCNHTMRKIEHYEDFNSKTKEQDTVRFENRIAAKEESDEEELFALAEEELSYEAFCIFKYIVSREWETPHHRKRPNTQQIARAFGYREEIIDSVMSEIRAFWNKSGWMVA